MWNNSIRIFLFLFFISGSFILCGDEQKIEWSHSQIAKAYKLEIRELKSKKTKSNIILNTTSYKVSKLSPGFYEYRIGILNAKEEILIYSDWTTLSIIQALEPEGPVDDVFYGGQQDKFQEIYITGKNFYEETEVEILSEQEKIPLKNLVRISETELKFVLDITNAKVGYYDLKIINPLNKVYIKKNFYILDKTREEAEKKMDNATHSKQGENNSVDSKYFIRSALVPGWGQFSSGDYYGSRTRIVKGITLFSSFLGTGFFIAGSYAGYITKKHQVERLNHFNNLVNYPYKPPVSLYELSSNLQFIKGSEHLNQKWHTVASASYALIGIYLINLIDAYFFTGSIQNAKAYNDLEKEFQLKAYVIPDSNSSMSIGRSYVLEYSFRF